MSSRGDDGVASTIYWHGWAGYEPETATPFLKLATSARVTLDIGAHVGYFTLLAAQANPAGRIYAFEPLPRVFERLTANVRLNGINNVTCEPMAMGNEKGHAEFFHVKNRIPSSSSLSQRFMTSIVPSDQLTSSPVEVTQIDDFVDANGLVVDLIKLDTETTEDSVLQGAVRTLSRDHPLIVCEVLEQAIGREIERILRPLGYEWFRLTPDGEIWCEHLTPDKHWRNFLFRPTAYEASNRS